MIRVILSNRFIFIPVGEVIFKYSTNSGATYNNVVSDGYWRTFKSWMDYINSAVAAITGYDLFTYEFTELTVNTATYPNFKAKIPVGRFAKIFGINPNEEMIPVNGKIYSKRWGLCRILFEDNYRIGNEVTLDEPLEYEGAYSGSGKSYQPSFYTKCIPFSVKLSNLTDRQAMDAVMFFNFIGSNTNCEFLNTATTPERFIELGLTYNNFQLMKTKSFLDKGKLFNTNDISFKMIWGF